MKWHVRLLRCCDGSQPDDEWAAGLVIEDNRSSAYDLVMRFCGMMQKYPRLFPGEVYSITQIMDNPRIVVVTDDRKVE